MIKAEEMFINLGRQQGRQYLNTNRKFIGIELDEKYFKIAKERISSIRDEDIIDLSNIDMSKIEYDFFVKKELKNSSMVGIKEWSSILSDLAEKVEEV